MADITLHDPLETVAQADDFHLFEPSPDGGRPYDAVYAGSGTAGNQDREVLVVLHKSMIAESRNNTRTGGRTRSIKRFERTLGLCAI
jgi:hypothetical protein